MIVPQNHWGGWCDTRGPLEEGTFRSLNPVWPPVHMWPWDTGLHLRSECRRVRGEEPETRWQQRKQEPKKMKLLLKLELFQIQTHISNRIHTETSLVVQWLKIHASTVGVMGSISGWEIKVLCAAWCSQNFFKNQNNSSLKKNKHIEPRICRRLGTTFCYSLFLFKKLN